MKSLKQKLDEMIENNDVNVVVLHPSQLEGLRADGAEIKEVPAQTVGEAFDERFVLAQQIIHELPQLPEGLPATAQVLYQEIRECILFKLYGASITLSSILVEYMLKFATFTVETDGSAGWDANKWDEFESIQFKAAVQRAKKAGLVPESLEVELDSFRQIIRNPYAHYNIQKISSLIGFTSGVVIDGSSDELQKRTIDPRENPGLQMLAKSEIDKARFLVVFQFADRLTKHLLADLKVRYGQ